MPGSIPGGSTNPFMPANTRTTRQAATKGNTRGKQPTLCQRTPPQTSTRTSTRRRDTLRTMRQPSRQDTQHAVWSTRAKMHHTQLPRLHTAPNAGRGRRDHPSVTRRITIRTIQHATHTPHLQPAQKRRTQAQSKRRNRNASLNRVVTAKTDKGPHPPPPAAKAPP